jgi:DNA-binding XRE family transcriptional regulator
MSKVQIIEQNGHPAFAVIPFEMWLQMQPSVEDIEDIALYDSAKKTNSGFRIPADILKRELSGEHPVKLWREYRKLTLETLATLVGISKAYLSQIENSKRNGTARIMKSLAKQLDIPLDVLVEDEEIKLTPSTTNPR